MGSWNAFWHRTQTNATIDRKRAIGNAHSKRSDRVSDHRPEDETIGRVKRFLMSELLDDRA
ncbi:hypothetical protein EBR56_03590 [bacterium]|nr:hypothetical protein [bacterium]